MAQDFESYRKAIFAYLQSTYNYEEALVHNLLTLYNLEEMAKTRPEHFYYQSPEYWAEFLLSD